MSVITAVAKAVAEGFKTAKNIVAKPGKLTYDMLKKYSYKELIKKGFSESTILSKVSDYYLKNQRILTINNLEGKTLSRALKLLKRGNVSQGVWIEKTQYDITKLDVRALKKISKSIGKDSFANKILTEFQNGEINPYQLNHILHSYASNPSQYESANKVDTVELLVKDYNISG